jgi:phosphate acetyltransferase
MNGKSGANFQRPVAAVKALPPTSTAVAHPCDESSLAGALDAGELGVIVLGAVVKRDTVESRLASCAVAALFASRHRQTAARAS